MGGASLDEPVKEGEGPKINGSVMLARADTEGEVMEKIRDDVYYKHGVWDTDKVSVLQQRLGCWILRWIQRAWRTTYAMRGCPE